MSFKVVIDSCGELTEEMRASGHFETASLTMQIDEYTIVDDETFDQADFLAKVAASPNCPKSSCPSPEAYMKSFDCGADHVYAVTLSAELSGSYNSAMLGRNLFMEKHPDAKVYVFNSRSASVGETLIGMKIQECEEAGLEFEETVEAVEAYIAEQTTWFVLENLDTLRKNGRLSKVKAFVATALKIKPVMSATNEGVIVQLDQARGYEQGNGQDGRLYCREGGPPGGADFSYLSLQLPGASPDAEGGIAKAAEFEERNYTGYSRNQQYVRQRRRNYCSCLRKNVEIVKKSCKVHVYVV